MNMFFRRKIINIEFNYLLFNMFFSKTDQEYGSCVFPHHNY
ncbi:hypothetical protein D3OALGA1CA_5723 [Olavius algarvensis associated proteobacterium Delta 3]|nr:hypothetical protein D3OALGB2SA_2454 [Olavius algarvensis associated proteobacterium Delta 3]CAB5170885.1 hypothetical protein D3OALGA1CA_5723 [Olavius algarvensis associated proteobacterium Delta 3]